MYICIPSESSAVATPSEEGLGMDSGGGSTGGSTGGSLWRECEVILKSELRII